MTWERARRIFWRLAGIEGEHAGLWLVFALQTWRSATFKPPPSGPANPTWAALIDTGGTFWIWLAAGVGAFQLVAVLADWRPLRVVALVSDLLLCMAVAVGILISNLRSPIGAAFAVFFVQAMLAYGRREWDGRERRKP